MDVIKTCKDCGVTASSIDEMRRLFSKHKKSPLGYRNWCKRCETNYRTKRYREIPEVAERVRGYALKSKKKRILFKNKRVTMDHNPRSGVCSECGKEGRTEIHHDEYDEKNPMANTRELCASCHATHHDFGSKSDGKTRPRINGKWTKFPSTSSTL